MEGEVGPQRGKMRPVLITPTTSFAGGSLTRRTDVMATGVKRALAIDEKSILIILIVNLLTFSRHCSVK